MENQLYLGFGYLGACLGAGLSLIGAGVGIGYLANAALEGTARQPEAAKTLQTLMLIAAALIEGLAFFALIICFMVANREAKPSAAHEPAAAVATH
jgi:F-type H+-transporting ATPase subunit c